jgi:hypothetical protein
MIKGLQIKGLKANIKGTNASAPRERRQSVSESNARVTVKALAVKALLWLHYGSMKDRVEDRERMQRAFSVRGRCSHLN